MQGVIDQSIEETWFHAGEYSDSLALSHLSGELPLYFEFFKNNPKSFLELRTKSVNIKELIKLEPLSNVMVSFSLSPEEISKEIDLRTPGLKARLDAMLALKKLGFKLGIHFDPIIFKQNTLELYRNLISELSRRSLLQVEYISLGVVRFTEEVYHEVKKNYPGSIIHGEKMITSFDQKVRYPKSRRIPLLNEIKEILITTEVPEEKIYFCME